MQNKKIRFRLTGDKRPESWQLPFTGLMLPKDVNGQKALKEVHYIPGAPSIWKEDYKGDEKPRQVFFEKGVLDVDPLDRNLLELCYKHPWFNIKFERYSRTDEARTKIEKYELQRKAEDKVMLSDVIEMKATAITLFGEGIINMSDWEVKAMLMEESRKDPEKILNIMGDQNYFAKYTGALALLRGVIEINHTRTAVVWADGRTIVRVATGKDPIQKLADFLSEPTEEAKVTLQELGESIKNKHSSRKSVEEQILEDQKAVSSSDEDEDVDQAPEMTVAEARELYKKQHGKQVPPRFINDIQWIKDRLELEPQK